MQLDMNNQQKREKFQEAGYDDFCEAHQMPYNNECPDCAQIVLDRVKEQQPSGKILRWVKASERSPSHRNAVCVKVVEGRYVEMYTEGRLRIDGTYHDLHNDCFYPSDQIEWLEELSAPASPVEEKPEEFQRWKALDIDDAIQQVTAVMREADNKFEDTGGGTRHYVRELLIPMLAEQGLVICKTQPPKPSSVIEGEGKHFGPGDTESLIQSIFVTLTENVKDYNADRLFKTAQLIGMQWAGMIDAVYEGAAQWESRCKEAQNKLNNLTAPAPVIEIGEQKREIPEQVLEKIGRLALHEASLHFNPIWSPDQNTACVICYTNGAKEFYRASHPAPAPIVGETHEDKMKCKTCVHQIISHENEGTDARCGCGHWDGLGDPNVPPHPSFDYWQNCKDYASTEQALPEEDNTESQEYRFKEGELTILYAKFKEMWKDEEALPGYQFFKEGFRLTRSELSAAKEEAAQLRAQITDLTTEVCRNSEDAANAIERIGVLRKKMREVYFAGFNQAHYSHVHPDICPPKEIEQAADEFFSQFEIKTKP